MLTDAVPERLLDAERLVETDAEGDFDDDVEGVADCDEKRDRVAIAVTELLAVEKRLGVD